MRLTRGTVALISLSALAILTLAVGVRSAGAGPAADPAPKTNYRDGLAGVDFSGLQADQKTRALDIMNAVGCDCGCGMTVAQCRVEDQTCPRSPGLAAKIVDGVKEGLDSAAIAASLGLAAAAPAPQAGPPSAVPPPLEISTASAPSRGKASAKVTLVEFADFQCPYCARATEVVNQVLERYPDDVRYVFKQLPLTSIHRFAEPAARAAFAAERQGKYWEMHDILFENYRALDDASLKKYAAQIGLDVARFEKDMVDPEIAARVQADMTEAQTLGVNSTPSFFMNGHRVPSWDLQTMSSLIEKARAGEDIGVAVAAANDAIRERQMAARRAQQQRNEQLATQVFDIDITGAPIKGSADAPVTIVEFGDFQCPFCANSQALLNQVLEAYPGKVRLAFKHLPLIQIHPNARPAAIASLAALEQGKFWEMREMLYKNYNKLNRETILQIAREVGLDMPKFEAAFTAEKNASVVDKDIADSRSALVSGTPTYFINGKRVMQRDFQTFQRMIEEALAQKQPSAS